jgi:phosphoribosylformimino-5-aminoimidazole carboxamide ribotide isomerase
MCRQFPGRLVLGIDARDGRVATQGWLQTSEVRATDLARDFAQEPIAAVIYTDIATDGMMSGPNVGAMAEMQAAVDLPVVASGGVTTKEDVARLAAVPMAGCIIGRALYEGTLTLAEALAASTS